MPESRNKQLEDNQRSDVSKSGHGKDDRRMHREDVRNDPSEERSASGSCGSAEPDDGADAGCREHVTGSGEDVGRPSLMRGCGEAEESDGWPGVAGEEVVHVRYEHDRRDAECADEHGDFASTVDAESTLHEEAREPSASDGAEAGSGVDDDERPLHVVEVEAIVVIEKFWKIEEIEPPDGIGEPFTEEEGPKAAVLYERRVDGLAFGDGGKLGLSEGGSAAVFVVREEQPDNEPDEAH